MQDCCNVSIILGKYKAVARWAMEIEKILKMEKMSVAMLPFFCGKACLVHYYSSFGEDA